MSDALNDALAELRREYLLDAPGRLAELRKDAAAFGAGETDATASLIGRFHRLAGSGGSYGFPDVSTIAREGERWLRESPAPTRAQESEARLEQLIDKLAHAYDAAARELGLPARGPAVTEFGWRALVIGSDRRLSDEVVAALSRPDSLPGRRAGRTSRANSSSPSDLTSSSSSSSRPAPIPTPPRRPGPVPARSGRDRSCW